MNLNNIYMNSPIFIQNIICSLYGWKEKKTRFSKDFFSFFESLKTSEYWSQDQIETYKNQQLFEVIKAASEDVPYYKQ